MPLNKETKPINKPEIFGLVNENCQKYLKCFNYMEITLGCTDVFEWYKRFKEGHRKVKDDSRSRRP